MLFRPALRSPGARLFANSERIFSRKEIIIIIIVVIIIIIIIVGMCRSGAALSLCLARCRLVAGPAFLAPSQLSPPSLSRPPSPCLSCSLEMDQKLKPRSIIMTTITTIIFMNP